ncbi:ANK_REP_REGION domain-containing protein [Psidium guajava]|nr:ANK_REP_REGION domain-containing protein [Psidium guajava]
MAALERQTSFPRKKMSKQLTAKRDDTPLHLVARAGDSESLLNALSESGEKELKGLLTKQNQSGETILYVAAESGHVDLVRELMGYYDIGSAGIKAKSGYDAFHIAAKQGDLDVLKILIEKSHELSMTTDSANTTALHTAAAQGHFEVVNFLLEECGNLATITRNNGKTALHSAARNGHSEVVKALLSKEPGLTTMCDKKGQTALHMAVKGQRTDLVEELLNLDPSPLNMVDNKGNTALHIATRKARAQILSKLLNHSDLEKAAVNKSGETALDTAEKAGQSEIAAVLRDHGVPSAKSINPPTPTGARELNQTVSDIKHEVHDQLEHTRQTRRRVQGIAKRLNKLHSEGLNNAINSTTVVAVLIATVAFAAIFSVPGQYADNPDDVPYKHSVGEANIAPKPEFLVFFIFDAIALFISLAVVVVQTSVVVIERKAKKQMMAVINKLMWLACVMVSVAFLALSYVVVGKRDWALAAGVTVIGAVIMMTTLGTMCYWVIMHRVEAHKLRSIRRSSMSSRSRSLSMSMMMSDSEILNSEFKKVYAL